MTTVALAGPPTLGQRFDSIVTDRLLAAGRCGPDGPRQAGGRQSTLALKIFTAVMALGLTLTGLLGITIAMMTRALRRGSLVMLALGAVLPLASMLG